MSLTTSKNIKSNTPSKFKRTKGYTLIEVMIALLIAGILMSYAIPSFRAFGIRQSITNNVNNLVTDLTFAKVTAVKHGQNVVVLSKGTLNWAGGWTIFIDGNADNAFGDPLDVLLRDEDAVNGLTMTASAAFVTFDSLGSAAPSGAMTVGVEHTDAPTTTVSVGLSGVISSSS